MITLRDLATHWLDRTRPYRPSAFWFWNADMTPDAMADTVAQMAAADIREFLIHPVHGLEIEYLSDAFFDRYRHALRLAKQHHLKVWVYDEYGWPSGVAGGKLLREHPEHRGWYLAFAKDEQGRVTATPRQSDRVLDNVMGAPWTRNEAGYLDTLSVEAVRCFIDMTYERIYRECGDLFSEVIVGFFTDEPVNMMDGRSDQPGDCLWRAVGMPWTPTLPEAFRKRFGYAIEPRYADLAGPGPSDLKRDYWTLVKEMHLTAYHGQLARWCREHGVKYTGHLGEDFPLIQVRFAGSPFQALSCMDEPGVDFLGAGNRDVDQRLTDMVVVPSIARHAGKERVYCEAYGISPFDLRLGSMLRTAQMLGIYGVNDIALMGFHQALDGMRKYFYWPPIFHTAPWWPFYPEYRDAVARSVGLIALGRRRARYAILYPQNALEQTDVFYREVYALDDPVSRMMDRVGRAVYEAGETYEYIFPEILDQAKVEHGAIVFPHAEYEAILAPGDIAFFDRSVAALDRIAAAGGRVCREPLDQLVADVKAAPPAWADRLRIANRTGDLRVCRFEFPDGELVALRNTGDRDQAITLSSSRYLTEWVPTTGDLVEAGHEAAAVLPPHSCRYFTLTAASMAGRPAQAQGTRVPIETRWQVAAELPNMARLNNLRFRHGGRWLDATPICSGGMTSPYRIGVPVAFKGEETIPFEAGFTCSAVPDRLGILFERNRLHDLRVNDRPVDLAKAEPLKVWDASCVWVDVRSVARAGENRVAGVLTFQAYETSTDNDGFFFGPYMPACNVCVAGDFRFLDDTLLAGPGDPRPLPLNLSMAGWEQYAGILTLGATVQVDPALAGRIRGLELTLIAEDAVEVLLDGASLGRRITRPYCFDTDPVTPGSHRLEVRIAGTSGNILHDPSPWGLTAASWLCNRP